MTGIRSSLASIVTRRREPEARKRDGWVGLGVLVIGVEDERLDAFERQFLTNLGNRLYGPRLGCPAGVGAGAPSAQGSEAFNGKRLNASARDGGQP